MSLSFWSLQHNRGRYYPKNQTNIYIYIFTIQYEPGFSPWGGKIPCRGEQLPTPGFWPGEFHGQRSLSGYSPLGSKESDMTEQLSLSLSWYSILHVYTYTCIQILYILLVYQHIYILYLYIYMCILFVHVWFYLNHMNLLIFVYI